MRAAFLILPVAACATATAPAGGLPSRAAVDGALERWDFGCWYAARTDPELDCVPVARRLVRSLRCRADAAPDRRPRVLCHFSGVRVASPRLIGRFGPECAWLVRDEAGLWQIDSFPDADVCDS